MDKNQKIGLGTAAIGRPQYINIKKGKSEKFDKVKFKQKGLAILEAAYDLGIRYFDTAPGYGMAEEILIEWLSTKNDKTIEVATKWGYSYVANFDTKATVHELKDHSVAQLLKQWEISKQLLPFLTTYQIHSATFETGVLDNQEVINQLAALKEKFNLKIGLSTTGSNQVAVLQKALTVNAHGSPLFDVFQVTYNILDQSLLTVADEMIASGKRIIIKEAMANGRLFRNDNYPAYNSLYVFLEELARKYEVGIDAIALQFCIATINPFMVLSGAAEEYQLIENLKANQFALDAEDINKLKSFKIDTEMYWNERKKLKWV